LPVQKGSTLSVFADVHCCIKFKFSLTTIFVWYFPLSPHSFQYKHIEKLVRILCWLVGQTKSCLHLQCINDYLHSNSHSIYLFCLFSGTFPFHKWLIHPKTFTTLHRWASYSLSYQMEIILLAGYKFTKVPRRQCQYLWTLQGNFAVKGNILSKPPILGRFQGGV